MYHTIEPRNVQAVLASDFESWGVAPMRLFVFKPFMGPGVGCLDGPAWVRSRSLLKPTFANSNIGDVRIENISKLVDTLIESIPSDGSTIDLQTYFSRFALDSATDLLFGEPVGALTTTTESSQAFLDAYNHGQKWLGLRLFLPHYNIFTRDPKFWESCRIARAFVTGYVKKTAAQIANETKLDHNDDNDHRNKKPDRLVLARELLRETPSHTEITNELLNIFMPAHETTAIALSNIFFHLARHPAIYTQARAEVLASSATNPHAPWTFTRLKALPYLQRIIKESLRLTPALGTTQRVCLRDTTLPTGGGPRGDAPVFVPRGSVALLSLYGMHRRRDLFGDDAHVFDPSRWEGLVPAPWSFVPFGGGPRVCLGQQFALTEVAFVAVRMLLAFESVRNRDEVWEFVEHYKMTTSSRNGVKVGLVAAASRQEMKETKN